MPNWSHVLDLQRRSRDNALHAAAALHRRRAESYEAQRAARIAVQSFVDGAHHEPPHRAISPDERADW